MKTSLLVTAALCMLGSCCTKQDCTGIDRSNMILFKGFTAGTADSVVIQCFETTSGTAIIVDSLYLRTDYYDDSDRAAYLRTAVNTAYQYRITLPATGKTYTLDHFEVAERNCNKCFPYHPSSDKYTNLTGYQVNGVVQAGSSIFIRP